MRIRVTPFRALRVAFAALWTDLSPSATESEGHRNTLRRQLRQLAQSWPFALLVALAAPLQVAWTGWQQARPG